MRTWKNMKRDAWHSPMAFGVRLWGGIILTGIVLGLIGAIAGNKTGPEYAFGFIVGAASYRFPVFSRWSSMRRFRKYREEQAQKSTPRTGPYSSFNP